MIVQTSGHCHHCGKDQWFPDEQGEPRCLCGAYPSIETLPYKEAEAHEKPHRDTGCRYEPSCLSCPRDVRDCILEPRAPGGAHTLSKTDICPYCGQSYHPSNTTQKTCPAPGCKRMMKQVSYRDRVLKREMEAQHE